MTCHHNLSWFLGLREGDNVRFKHRSFSNGHGDCSVNGDFSFRPSKRVSRNHFTLKGVGLEVSGLQVSPRRAEATAKLKAKRVSGSDPTPSEAGATEEPPEQFQLGFAALSNHQNTGASDHFGAVASSSERSSLA